MSTIALRQLERRLLQETGRRMARLGFTSRPKGQTFLRPFKDGLAAVHLAFMEHTSDFDVTTDVAVRFEAVEELVNRFNFLLSEKEKAATFTLGAELGNLESGQPCRVTIAGAGDVGGAAERIVDTLERVGLPYIERFSRPEAAYDMLSRDDREAWVHSPIHAERAKRACAFLEVLGRRSELRALGARKLLFLESLKDPGAASFTKLLSTLTPGTMRS